MLASTSEVIGINTAVILGGQGIAFAVPIATATHVISALRLERVRRGFLGVAGADTAIPRRVARAVDLRVLRRGDDRHLSVVPVELPSHRHTVRPRPRRASRPARGRVVSFGRAISALAARFGRSR